MGRVVGALLACVAVLLGGCASDGVEGEPSPAEATAVQSIPQPTVAPSGLHLPPRPRDVPIDGVDPCSLLTETQRGELGFGDQGFGKVDESRLYDGPVPSCLFQGKAPRNTTVGVGVVATAGVERYAENDLDVDLRLLTVQGFPAVEVVPRRYVDYCVVVVDTAQGQLVEVQYGDVALPPPIPRDELCRDAQQVAEEVLETLLARY